MENFIKRIPQIRLRAFRAIDEPQTCALFIEGHTRVLTSIGITKVTSSKNQWSENPGAFVIVVESLNGKNIHGGARVHVSGGAKPLPIEEATSALDLSVPALIQRYAASGTGEVCGLWNSHELAGHGIGSPLLIRAGIAISSQIGLRSLFALCAPYTVKPVVNCGMVLEDSIGNKGTFYYPKLDLIATAMILKDVNELSSGQTEDKNAIFEMRSKPDDLILNNLKQKDILIEFKLRIPRLDQWDLIQFICSAQQSKKADTSSEPPTEFL